MHVLILLIGGNPLPNYVVVKYLLDTAKLETEQETLPTPDRVILLHSNDTKRFAEKLKSESFIGNKGILANLGDDERNTKRVKEVLDEKLKEIKPITSIHLNYTGGTKPMAVHSYLKTLDFAKDLPRDPIFSYLDPERFKITLDDSDNSFPASDKDDLRDAVDISIKKLFDIHDMNYKNGETDSTYLTKTVNLEQFLPEMLPQILDERPGNQTWLTKIANEKNQFEDRKSKSRGKLKWYPKESKERLAGIKQLNNTLFSGITRDIRSLNRLFPGDRFDVKSPDCEEKFTIFLNFFTGKWLEDLMLHTLQQLKTQGEIDYTDIRKSVFAEHNRRPCELDVIVMKGYQMFLLSCTTSKKINDVKQKAFEALYRADQLGGEHAQVIIVSCLPEKPQQHDQSGENALSKLREDLQSFEARNIKRCSELLIGSDELKDKEKLKSTLTAIINNEVSYAMFKRI